MPPRPRPRAKPTLKKPHKGREGVKKGQSWVEGSQAGLAEGKAGGEAGLEDQQVGKQLFEIIV